MRLHLVVQPNGGVHVDLVPRQVALRLKVKGKHVNVRLVPADAKVRTPRGGGYAPCWHLPASLARRASSVWRRRSRERCLQAATAVRSPRRPGSSSLCHPALPLLRPQHPACLHAGPARLPLLALRPAGRPLPRLGRHGPHLPPQLHLKPAPGQPCDGAEAGRTAAAPSAARKWTPQGRCRHAPTRFFSHPGRAKPSC